MKQLLKPKKYTVEEITVRLLLVAGVSFSLLQFLYNRSLWLDEAMLALNIINRNVFELLKPLDSGQAAPPLFLWIEKLFSTLLPNTEYGLRLFPLLCYWAAIYFFYKIVQTHLRNIYGTIIALSFFVINWMLIYYSSEVKQYMGDVLVLLVVFHLVTKDYRSERTKYYVLGIVGVLSVYLSNVAPIVLSTAGLYLLYTHFFVLKQKPVCLLALFGAWLVAFAVYYYFFVYEHPLQEVMVASYVKNYHDFLPYSSLSDFFEFIDGKRSVMFGTFVPALSRPFVIAIKILLLLTFLAGMLHLIIKKKWGIMIFTCIPPVLHLALSAFQLYPFAVRMTIYLLPAIMIICTFGFLSVIKFLPNHLKIKRYRFLILLFPLILFYNRYSSYKDGGLVKGETDGIKGSIKYIQENREGNEKIYAYTYSHAAAAYYQAIGLVPRIEAAGFPCEQHLSVIAGMHSEVKSEEDINELYIKDLEKLQGRNWILFTLQSPGSEKYITNKLDARYQRLKEFHTAGSSAYLYDFGE
jgi:hypothetical protein